MRVQLYVVVAVACLPAAGCEQTETKRGLDGTWMGVRFTNREGNQNDAYGRTIPWTIAGNTITISDPTHQEGSQGTFKVDDETRPRKIDAEATYGKGSFAWSGIYELEGNSLKVCYVFRRPGTESRPKEFKAKPGVLLVLKRVGS